MPAPPTLGPRLSSILTLIEEAQSDYDVLWDCCCDHGYLGINILSRKLAEHVVFVDQIASIMALLKPRLKDHPTGQYQLITGDVGQLKFDKSRRHLLIIAGVGGENIVKMLEDIEHQQPDTPLDFLFCPATTQYHLRQYLASRNYSLEHEALVTEKDRDYEIIYVRHADNALKHTPISLTGRMWQGEKTEHLRYLNKLVTHYRNQSRTDPTGQKHRVMQHYETCLADIS